jgi:hypothetical protein
VTVLFGMVWILCGLVQEFLDEPAEVGELPDPEI